MKTLENSKEDLRVRRTKRNIREAFLRMSLTKDIEDMRVSELAREAEIARKTVYLHYKNIDDIADDVCDTLTSQIIPKFTGDMESDIETIYTFFDNAEEPVTKLLFGGGYQVQGEILP